MNRCIHYSFLFIMIFSNSIFKPGIHAQTNPCDPVELSYGETAQVKWDNHLIHQPESEFPCPELSFFKYWMELEVDTLKRNIHIIFDNKPDYPVSIVIGKWKNSCEGSLAYLNRHIFCGVLKDTMEFTCLPVGKIQIAMTTQTISDGEFAISIKSIRETPDCATNHNCTTPHRFNNFQLNGNFHCHTGCNENACGEDFAFSGCNLRTSVVWYAINVPIVQGIPVYHLEVKSDDFNPVIQLFRNPCMGNMISTCIVGNNGILTEDLHVNHQGGWMYLAVGSEDGRNGTFELCVSGSVIFNNCAVYTNILPVSTSDNSPLFGPYKPSEEVKFRYEFSFIATNGCQWIHGIVPVFGSSWDIEGSNFPNQQQQGNWTWFSEGVVTFNQLNSNVYHYLDEDENIQICSPLIDTTCVGLPLSEGALLPAGWFWINQPGSCGGEIFNPNNTWGMPCGCGTICFFGMDFTIRVKDKQFFADFGYFPTGLAVFNFSDIQTGCYFGGTNEFCNADLPHVHYSNVLHCDEVPSFSEDITICSGNSIFLPLELPDMPDGTQFEWIPEDSTQVVGKSSGEGLNFHQFLTNSETSPVTTQYKVYTVLPNGCRSEQPGEINITVLPGIQDAFVVSSVNQDSLCVHTEIELAIEHEGQGTADVDYLWLPSGDTTSSSVFEINQAGINSTAAFVIAENGCATFVWKEMYGIENPQVQVQVSMDIMNRGMAQVIIDGGMEPYEIVWSDGTTGESVSDLEPGDYFVNVLDASGCLTSTSFTVHECDTEISIQTDSVTCHGVADGSIEVLVEQAHGTPTILWEDESDAFLLENLAPGTYAAMLTDSLCEYSITAIVQDKEPESIHIEGASSFCEGESTQICISGDYETYLWSTGATDSCVILSTSGIYTVEATSQGGCISVGEIIVQEEFVPVIELVGPFELNCPDASIEICLDMFEVEWSTGSQEDCIVITDPGIYSLTVTFVGGCTSDASFTIESTVDEVVLEDIHINHPTEGNGNGSLEVILTGGYLPYAYSWMDENGTIVGEGALATELNAGVYNLVVTDDAGCTYEFGPFELILSTNTSEYLPERINIYPNPFSNIIYIEMETPEMITKINIRSVSGSVLKSFAPVIENGLLQLEVPTLPSGTYFLELFIDGRPFYNTLIKME